jgi:hypothetical protein|tara:strand:- start:206 stop:370 length:165 start_codon:yes stop_codon:yes gene_type:complete
VFFILFVYLEYSCFTERLVTAGVIIELREFLVLVLIAAGSCVVIVLILERLRGC